MSLRRGAILAVLAAALGVAGYFHFGGGQDGAGDGAPIAAVSLPDTFSARAQLGRETFDANCASCHGRNAAGQDGVGPPLVHVIYEPGHHGDESIQRAVAHGARSHHWRFGDMPPVEGLSRRDVAAIVAYIRELQRANGIQ